MKQLHFIKPGRLEWLDIDEPKLQGPGDAIVRPIAVARCDLDLPIIKGDTPYVGPFPMGHEFVADIVSLGEEVKNFHIGQRVVVPFQISCGSCFNCRRHLTGSCKTVPHLSMYGFGAVGGDWGGALSDLVRVPFAANMLVPVPEGIDPAAIASASDNLPDAWRTVGPYLEEFPESSVLIMGGAAYSISLYAVAIASALGASKIGYVDTDPERLALAESLGAKAIERNPKTRRLGQYDITVDASGHPAALACALRSTAAGGICTSVAIYFTDTTPVPLLEMYTTGVTFKTSRVNARANIEKVLSLVESGRLHPERVNTRVASWDTAAEALTEPTVKVVILR